MRVWVQLLLGVFLSAAAVSAEIPKNEEGPLYWGGWKMPSSLPPERIQRLLHQATLSLHDRGFRYLGELGDFFHGHMLVEQRGRGESRVLIPRAILYHTQEDASAAHWGKRNVDRKYDYLNHLARNWIQWLHDDPEQDGLVIENAIRYLDIANKKNPEQFRSGSVPDQRFAYTIHAHNLNSQLLGFDQFGALQFEFYRMKCEGEEVSSSDRGPIKVDVPTIGAICLKLSTTTMFIENSTFSPPTPPQGQLAALR